MTQILCLSRSPGPGVEDCGPVVNTAVRGLGGQDGILGRCLVLLSVQREKLESFRFEGLI